MMPAPQDSDYLVRFAIFQFVNILKQIAARSHLSRYSVWQEMTEPFKQMHSDAEFLLTASVISSQYPVQTCDEIRILAVPAVHRIYRHKSFEQLAVILSAIMALY